MTAINFSGRVAIITGAGAGLGKQYAIELAKRGAQVVVNDLGGALDGAGEGSSSPADQVVEEIKALGGEAVANYDNVATVAGGENIVKTAIDHFGKVDILVNNAGILRDMSLVKMEAENWDTVVNVHLRGTYCVTRPAFINMKQNNYGRIVNTGSISGLFGNFGQTNYGSAKMGIAGFTNTLKLEGAKYNIKANVILPSALTRMSEDVMPSDIAENFKPEYVTPAVLYMCSEQCEDTGFYINAFAGYYSRSNIVTGPGTTFSKVPTPEEFMEKWDSISTLENAKFHHDLNTMLMEALKAQIGKGQ